MICIKVLDLPKGFEYWQYKPLRPTVYLVRRANTLPFLRYRSSAENPLQLLVGDTIGFVSEKDIPAPLLELMNPYAGHPVYAEQIIKDSRGKTKRTTTTA